MHHCRQPALQPRAVLARQSNERLRVREGSLTSPPTRDNRAAGDNGAVGQLKFDHLAPYKDRVTESHGTSDAGKHVVSGIAINGSFINQTAHLRQALQPPGSRQVLDAEHHPSPAGVTAELSDAQGADRNASDAAKDVRSSTRVKRIV